MQTLGAGAGTVSQLEEGAHYQPIRRAVLTASRVRIQEAGCGIRTGKCRKGRRDDWIRSDLEPKVALAVMMSHCFGGGFLRVPEAPWEHSLHGPRLPIPFAVVRETWGDTFWQKNHIKSLGGH